MVCSVFLCHMYLWSVLSFFATCIYGLFCLSLPHVFMVCSFFLCHMYLWSVLSFFFTCIYGLFFLSLSHVFMVCSFFLCHMYLRSVLSFFATCIYGLFFLSLSHVFMVCSFFLCHMYLWSVLFFFATGTCVQSLSFTAFSAVGIRVRLSVFALLELVSGYQCISQFFVSCCALAVRQLHHWRFELEFFPSRLPCGQPYKFYFEANSI